MEASHPHRPSIMQSSSEEGATSFQTFQNQTSRCAGCDLFLYPVSIPICSICNNFVNLTSSTCDHMPHAQFLSVQFLRNKVQQNVMSISYHPLTRSVKLLSHLVKLSFEKMQLSHVNIHIFRSSCWIWLLQHVKKLHSVSLLSSLLCIRSINTKH